MLYCLATLVGQSDEFPPGVFSDSSKIGQDVRKLVHRRWVFLKSEKAPGRIYFVIVFCFRVSHCMSYLDAAPTQSILTESRGMAHGWVPF
jgi:hypothetical protein